MLRLFFLIFWAFAKKRRKKIFFAKNAFFGFRRHLSKFIKQKSAFVFSAPGYPPFRLSASFFRSTLFRFKTPAARLLSLTRF